MMLTRRPATILTGFLGSGKTTLLNRILECTPEKKIAVIVNEFGEIGIDRQLVVRSDEEIVELNNGCLCCTVRGDLIRIVDNIFSRYDTIDHLVIETTGLADPGPVIQSFIVDDRMQARLLLDAVITTVDCRHVWTQLASHEAQEQIAFADVVLLNKIDLVDPAEVDRIERKVRSMNRFAAIHRTERSAVDLDLILGLGAFDLKNILSVAPDLLEEEDHEHDASVSSVCITAPGTVDGSRFNKWMFDLVQTRGADLFRMKGILDLDAAAPTIRVPRRAHDPGRPARTALGTGEARRNELVFIGRDLDRPALEQGFASCMM